MEIRTLKEARLFLDGPHPAIRVDRREGRAPLRRHERGRDAAGGGLRAAQWLSEQGEGTESVLKSALRNGSFAPNGKHLDRSTPVTGRRGGQAWLRRWANSGHHGTY